MVNTFLNFFVNFFLLLIIFSCLTKQKKHAYSKANEEVAWESLPVQPLFFYFTDEKRNE